MKRGAAHWLLVAALVALAAVYAVWLARGEHLVAALAVLVALPLAAVAHQLFLATSGRGEGGADDSQVIRTYHAMNGTGSSR